MAKQLVVEFLHDGVRFVVFKKRCAGVAVLVAADEDGLVVARRGVAGIQFDNKPGGRRENFGALDGALGDGDLRCVPR